MATKKAAPAKAAPKVKKLTPMSKSALINALLESAPGLNRKQIKQIVESLEDIGHKQLKKQGVFTVPGFAKFTVVKKKATPERQGRNPATGEAMTIKAKPARKMVRARPIKAIKMAID
ncbi:MAG: DNA-binding protein [Myxococcales bacterium]|nr:DNA-binding protein [Myxococcales bacterium]